MVKGQLIYKNGDFYYGELKNGELHGRGLYKFKNGSVYEGQFKNNEFDGRGKLIDAFNQITIIGEFEGGTAHGKCKINYADQSVYEGEICKGQRSGKGIYTFSPNSEQKAYSGSFLSDDFEGYGELIFKSGMIYKGHFNKNKFNIEGELTSNEFKYIGEFKNGYFQGKGIIKYTSGQSYEGEFSSNQKHGVGKYVYKDGSFYQGQWKNDKRHGKGKLMMADKSYFGGIFKNDAYEGDGVYKFDGWAVQSDFNDSEMDGNVKMIKQNVIINGVYEKGVKEGLFQIKKALKNGKQISYRGEFHQDREKPYSVSYSQRF